MMKDAGPEGEHWFHIDKSAAHKLDLWRLVTAQMDICEDRPTRLFHVKFVLACGKEVVTGVDGRYEIAIRQCIVDLKTSGCRANLSDAYSYELPDRLFEDGTSAEETSAKSSKAGLGGQVKIKAGIAKRAAGILGVSLAKEGEAKQSKVRRTKSKRRVMLIACNGQHWTVGDDEYGDPRNYGGQLRERYFNEVEGKSLCSVSFDRDVDHAKLTTEVRAKFGQLSVYLLDDTDQPSSKLTAGHVDDVGYALRSRIKGIALAKAVRERQKHVYPELPAAEFLLAAETILAYCPPNRASSDATRKALSKRARS